MARRQTVRIEGLKELEKALGELPKATGKNVLRRVLKKRAEPVAEGMRELAPEDADHLGRRGAILKKSVRVSTKLSKRQKSEHRKMFRNDKASAEVFVGVGPVPHAHMQEFGTVRHDPQPFARPAWDAGKMQMLEGIKDDLWTEIEKSAARQRRKQMKRARRRLGLE